MNPSASPPPASSSFPSIAQAASISDHQPGSYAERGASVPFTTPVLGGAFVRTGTTGTAELIVGNPSGNRGVYILPLRNLQAICQPTLHDMRLHAEISMLRAFTPAAIRQATRKVAATGITGREAMRSAELAEPALRAAQSEARLALRQQLARQGGSGTGLAALAARLGCPANILEAGLLACADLLAEIGIVPKAHDHGVRDHGLARRMARLGAMATALPDMTQAGLHGNFGRDTVGLATLAQTTHALATTLLVDIERRLADLPRLLQDFQREPLAVSQALSRIDWAMDGWDRVCALWQDTANAPTPPGRAAVLEMVTQAPKLPAETIGWGNPDAAVSARQDSPKPNAQGRSVNWSSRISLTDLVARNERLVAAVVGVT